MKNINTVVCGTGFVGRVHMEAVRRVGFVELYGICDTVVDKAKSLAEEFHCKAFTNFQDVVAAGGPDSASLTFPDYCPERRFRLAGPEMRIGRRSASQGLEPEIDLTGPPTDPGVSRMHAALIAEPDGSWTLLDPGSENGTLVNGTEIAAGVRVPLHDGDRIHLGAWTAITIRAS